MIWEHFLILIMELYPVPSNLECAGQQESMELLCKTDWPNCSGKGVCMCTGVGDVGKDPISFLEQGPSVKFRTYKAVPQMASSNSQGACTHIVCNHIAANF